MRGSEFVLAGTYQFSSERGEWVAMVCKQQGRDVLVLTVGCENTEEAIMAWISNTIALMREHQSFEVQAPDMYERAGIVHPDNRRDRAH